MMISYLKINLWIILAIIEQIFGCNDDRVYIRVFNVDDYSYAFVNQHYVVSQSFGTDSKFVDVAPYIHNGLNYFTFLTYNTGRHYTWGFQIMKNNYSIFNHKAGLVGSVGADSNSLARTNRFVYNKTISLNITKCSNIVTTPSQIDCNNSNDKYSIRLFNTDDTSYAYLNQSLIKSSSLDQDSGFLDITPSIRIGVNKLTFLTRNLAGSYAWGFQIMKNHDIIFDDRGGLVGSIGADNNNLLRTHQYVYNKTILINVTKCQTLITTQSTKYTTTKGQTSSYMFSTSSSYSLFQNITSFFIPEQCNNTKYVGFTCNITNNKCSSLNPCQNNGTCYNVDNHTLGFMCSCLSDYNGTYCEFDHRPCKRNTCLNDGQCFETSPTTYNCACNNGWEGNHCESMINHCNLKNITCENNGICRPILLNYTCDCLGVNYYSGRHCEILSDKIIIFKASSKVFATIAIVALSSVVMFIIILDILKYCFGIDPINKYRRKLRRKKQIRKQVFIQRFVYVNATPE